MNAWMTDPAQALRLLTGIALFLFGMTLMGDGLRAASDGRLEPVLYRLSNTTWKGVLLGTAVTAVLQSSCATSAMAVGFVNAGMMKPRQAVGVILGSILGTSVTGWIICLGYAGGGGMIGELLSARTLACLAAAVGAVLRISGRDGARRWAGDVLMGFAVLMAGLAVMSAAAESLGSQPWFTGAMRSMTNPVAGAVIGGVISVVLQSASAAVGVMQALSVTGAVTGGMALPLLLGIAVGAGVPVLFAAIGAGAEARRTAYVYIIAAGMGAFLVGGAFYAVHLFAGFGFMDEAVDPQSIALMNTLLRLAMLLVLIPMAGLPERTARALVPDSPRRKSRAPKTAA